MARKSIIFILFFLPMVAFTQIRTGIIVYQNINQPFGTILPEGTIVKITDSVETYELLGKFSDTCNMADVFTSGEWRYFPRKTESGWQVNENNVVLINGLDSVGIGTNTPTTSFTLNGNMSFGTSIVDSVIIDDGISQSEMSRIMVYNDTHDSWGDWTGGSIFAAGAENQVITLFSISTGRLFLRNNDTINAIVFEMMGGDNITIQFNAQTNTWIEIGRVDFQPYSTCSTGMGTEGGTYGGVTYVSATGGTGISITGSPITSIGTLNITNTAPDKIVTINPGDSISVTGTYPSFTIKNTAPDKIVTVNSGVGIGVTGSYPNFTIANTASGDSIFRRNDEKVTLRNANDSVGLGMTPVSDFSLHGNMSFASKVVDSSMIDDGIQQLEMSRIMIYNDSVSSWYDWTYGSGAVIEDGVENQLITIFSTGLGKLYLRNNDTLNMVVFEMFGGDNITLQYSDNTWTEVGRVDFLPYSECASGGGGVTAGVTYVGATGGTGISVTGSPITSSGILNITNTAPDRVVSMNGGTGISVSGVYPNYTLENTSPDRPVAILAGDSIFVSGTYPNFTIRNQSPDKIITLEAGVGISITGEYPEYTITNIAPSAGGTVTSVGFTAANGFTATITNPTTTPNITSLNLRDADVYGLKGQSTYTGTDFNVTAGTVSLDYINGQKTSSSLNGFLSSEDWAYFFAKEPAITAATTDYYWRGDKQWTLFPADSSRKYSAGIGITISGTYPDYVITNSSPSSGGTVKAVSGTLPISSTGGITPNISIATANTTTTGAISSTDWNTFNNKLSSTLVSGSIFVGNSSNVATAAAMSGDATIANTGALTIANQAVTSAKISDNNVTGEKIYLSGNVQGDIMYFNGIDWVRLAPGNSGQYLKTQGSNANPTWSSVPAGNVGTVTSVGFQNINGFTGTITNPTSTPVLSIVQQDASADGVTKGLSTYTISDFNTTSGLVSLDYTNGQKASTSTIGYLTDTDWDTFYGKEDSISEGTTSQYWRGDKTWQTLPTNYEPPVTKGNLTGTTNQITVTGGTGAVIGNGTSLSLPQNINTTAVPQFGGLQVGNIVAPELYSTPFISDTSLRAYYRLSNTTDASGRGYNLSSYLPSYVTGKFDNAAAFAASTSSVFYTQSNLDIKTKSMSVSFWFKRTGTDYGSYLVFTCSSSPNIATYISASTSGIGVTRYCNGLNNYTISKAAAVGTTNWHHAVYTYDDSYMRLYFDGNLLDSLYCVTTSGSNFTFGLAYFGLNYNSSVPHGDQIIDDVAVFRKALSSSEVSSLYPTGYAIPSTIGQASQVLTAPTTGNTLTWATPSTGSGTVDSIIQGTGMLNSANPITTTGTVGIDTNYTMVFKDTLSPASKGKIATQFQTIPKSVFDAAGDLIVGSGSDAYAKFTKGSGGQVLAVKSDETGLEWKAITGNTGGTVTSISQGTGMFNSANPIEASGTVGVDTTKVVMFNDTIGTNETGKIETKYHATTTFEPKITAQGSNSYYYDGTKGWSALPEGTAYTADGITLHKDGVQFSNITKDSTYVKSGTGIRVDSTSTSKNTYTINNIIKDSTYLKAGTGISLDSTGTPKNTYTITNQSPESTMVSNQGSGTGTIAMAMTNTQVNLKTIAAGTNITITNNADNIVIASSGSTTHGTVTKVYGIAPLVSTPDTITSTGTITITAATGSSDGYLTSTNWNNFNDKMNNPLLAKGDLVYSIEGATPRRLPIAGTSGKYLVSNGSTPEWGTLPTVTVHDAVSLGTANGLSLVYDDQLLSMALGSASTIGALNTTDWKKIDTSYTYHIKSVSSTAPMSLTLSNRNINASMPAATTSTNGYLTSTDWNIFNNKVTSVSGTSPISVTSGVTPNVSIPPASTSANGYLTNTDWNTFNNKENSLGYPSSDGQILSSTTHGVRSWISLPTMPTQYWGKSGSTLSPLLNEALTISQYLTVGKNGTSSGELNFIASDNDATKISINTSDQMLFSGGSGGYYFNAGHAIIDNGTSLKWGTNVSQTSISGNSSGSSAAYLNFSTLNTSRIYITEGGSVGINTLAPSSSYKLDVNGAGRIKGILNMNDAYSLPSTSGSSGQYLSVPSSGTTLTWTSLPAAINYWSQNGSNNIYNNNTGLRVGINTNAPAYTLDVNGNQRTKGVIIINDAYTLPSATGAAGQYLTVPSSGTTLAWTTQPTAVNYWTLSGSNVYNNSGTKIGVNNSSPVNALDVTGDVNLTGVLKTDGYAGVAGDFLINNGSDSPTWRVPSIDEMNDVNTANADNGQVLKWNGDSWIPADDIVGEGGTSGTYIPNLENLGTGADVFKGTLFSPDTVYQFRTITGSSGVVITENTNTIDISLEIPSEEAYVILADSNIYDSGYITPYYADGHYEPIIAPSTDSTKYWSGNKTWKPVTIDVALADSNTIDAGYYLTPYHADITYEPKVTKYNVTGSGDGKILVQNGDSTVFKNNMYIDADESKFNHDALLNYRTTQHFFQEEIDTLNPGAGLVGTYANGLIYKTTDNTVQWDEAYDSLNTWIPKYIIDAAGDLVVGTGNNTVARLAKGTDKQVLKMVDGSVVWGTDSVGTSGSSHVEATSGSIDNGLTVDAGQVIRIKKASIDSTGVLSADDWDTFNKKQEALTFGDLATSDSIINFLSGSDTVDAVIGSGITLSIDETKINHNNLKNYSTLRHFRQVSIDSVSNIGNGIVTSSAGKLGITPNNTVHWDSAYQYRLIRANGTAPLTLALSNNSLTGSITAGDSTHDGYLKYTDWRIFKAKEPAITAGTSTSQYWSGLKSWQTLHGLDSVWSSITLGRTTYNGKLNFKATDNDASDIAVTTSDEMKFNNASGGYIMDGVLSSTSLATGGITATGDAALYGHLSVDRVGQSTGYDSIYVKDIATNLMKTSVLPANTSLWTASGNNIYNNNTANVGIGITNATKKFEVKGQVKLDSAVYIPTLASGGAGDSIVLWEPSTGKLKYGTRSTSVGFADPMTTRGDIIYRNAANATTRLGRGSDGQVLKTVGSDLVWSTLDEGHSAVTIASPRNGLNVNGNQVLNIDTASTSDTGVLTSYTYNKFYNKQDYITPTTSADYYRGDKTFQTLNTLAVPEATNLYFTTSRARQSVSSTALGLTYTVGDGVFSLTSGWEIPTTAKIADWNESYNWGEHLATSLGSGSQVYRDKTANVLNFRSLTAGSGISLNQTSDKIEITNTLQDQTVSLTGAGINAVTGTYPNFTITGTEVDGSLANEGKLTVGAGGSNYAEIVSNTWSGSPINIYALTGLSITKNESVNSISLTNTDPDQSISNELQQLSYSDGMITISAGGGTPNSVVIPSGTITSITASSPLTGGTITSSGAIGITQSSSLLDGYLSSEDWSTFYNSYRREDTATVLLSRERADRTYQKIITGTTGYIPKFSLTLSTGANPFSASHLYDNGTSMSVSSALSVSGMLTLGSSPTSYSFPTSVGSIGQILQVSRAASELEWVNPPPTYNDPMTLKGDMVYLSLNAGTPSRLGIGSSNQVLTVINGLPSWQNAATGFVDPTIEDGDMIVRKMIDRDLVTTRLAAGLSNNTKVLTVVGGVPSWATLPTGTSHNLVTIKNATSGLSIGIDQRLDMDSAYASYGGFLTSKDWNRFNKRARITYTAANYIPKVASDTSLVNSNMTIDGDTVEVAGGISVTKGINIPSSIYPDNSYSGTTATFVAGEALVFGNVVSISGVDEVSLATNTVDNPAIGIVVSSDYSSSGDHVTILLSGFIRKTSTWFAGTNAGTKVYLGTNGVATTTAPTTSGSIVQILGVTTNVDRMYWNPQLVTVVLK